MTRKKVIHRRGSFIQNFLRGQKNQENDHILQLHFFNCQNNNDEISNFATIMDINWFSSLLYERHNTATIVATTNY